MSGLPDPFDLAQGVGNGRGYHGGAELSRTGEGEVKDVSRRTYQRNDIQVNYVDEVTGLTCLERMMSGKPPIGLDGNMIQLHCY